MKAVLGVTDTLSLTKTALRDASALGFDRQMIAAAIAGLNSRMFVKSMTTFADHQVWQDVYHAPADGLLLYIKIQADTVTAFKLVSFKEK